VSIPDYLMSTVDFICPGSFAAGCPHVCDGKGQSVFTCKTT
jgi:hypothetical protein